MLSGKSVKRFWNALRQWAQGSLGRSVVAAPAAASELEGPLAVDGSPWALLENARALEAASAFDAAIALYLEVAAHFPLERGRAESAIARLYAMRGDAEADAVCTWYTRLAFEYAASALGRQRVNRPMLERLLWRSTATIACRTERHAPDEAVAILQRYLSIAPPSPFATDARIWMESMVLRTVPAPAVPFAAASLPWGPVLAAQA